MCDPSLTRFQKATMAIGEPWICEPDAPMTSSEQLKDAVEDLAKATDEERLRQWNFSAGPGVLPLPVLRQMQRDLLCLPGVGCSILEVSHRSPAFEKIISAAESHLRQLLSIPTNYRVLFMSGGGTGQFAAVVYNLFLGRYAATEARTRVADYFVTGGWSDKAAAEAARLGVPVNRVVDTKAAQHNGAIPGVETWTVSPKERTAYRYYCDNETVHGVEWPATAVSDRLRQIDGNDAGPPLVCDMSSNLLTRPVDIARFGLIFAGAQKNLGPAGVTVVIVRDDLLLKDGARPAGSVATPVSLDYALTAENASLYNTPATSAIYGVSLVLQWVRERGGVAGMTERQALKAGLVYAAMERSGGVFVPAVVAAAPAVRSRTNLPFRVCRVTAAGPVPDAALEAAFLKAAATKGLLELKGHRSVGGIRASLYNAMPIQGARVLVAFMDSFAREVRDGTQK